MCFSLCVFSCKSQKELSTVTKTKAKSEIANEEYRTEEKIELNTAKYNRETLIDSLHKGFSIITPDGHFYDYEIDTVPEILKRVFPDVVFTRFYKPNVPGYTRGTVYYENKPYNISINFNVLYHKMSFIEPPGF